jgi:hypothetical protein
MTGTLRLHQLCLVAHDLAPWEAAFNGIFNTGPCFHSDLFGGKFGIHNVVFEVGGSFLEIVGLNPGVDPRTAPAGRYLQRRGGDGGYMVILECNDVARREAVMAQLGVRIVFHPDHDGFNEIQLHPADTGGSLISLNETAGRDGLIGPYLPAGPDWWLKTQPQSLAREIVAAELQSDDPEALAARWSRILERPVVRDAQGLPRIVLDLGALRFVQATDGRGEGLGGMDLVVTDRDAVLAAARARGLPVQGDTLTLCGTRMRLISY